MVRNIHIYIELYIYGNNKSTKKTFLFLRVSNGIWDKNSLNSRLKHDFVIQMCKILVPHNYNYVVMVEMPHHSYIKGGF